MRRPRLPAIPGHAPAPLALPHAHAATRGPQVKVRLQNPLNPYSGAWHCATSIVRYEGVSDRRGCPCKRGEDAVPWAGRRARQLCMNASVGRRPLHPPVALAATSLPATHRLVWPLPAPVPRRRRARYTAA